jgi:hypothetical protein
MKGDKVDIKRAFIGLVYALVREQLFMDGYSLGEYCATPHKTIFTKSMQDKEVYNLLNDVWNIVERNDCYEYCFKDKIKIISNSAKQDYGDKVDAFIVVKLKEEEVVIHMKTMGCKYEVAVHIY